MAPAAGVQAYTSPKSSAGNGNENQQQVCSAAELLNYDVQRRWGEGVRKEEGGGRREEEGESGALRRALDRGTPRSLVRRDPGPQRLLRLGLREGPRWSAPVSTSDSSATSAIVLSLK